MVDTGVFFTCMTSSSESKPARTTGICSVLRRQHAKKHDVLKPFFIFFQLVLRKDTPFAPTGAGGFPTVSGILETSAQEDSGESFLRFCSRMACESKR